jgi:hypothetical protein
MKIKANGSYATQARPTGGNISAPPLPPFLAPPTPGIPTYTYIAFAKNQDPSGADFFYNSNLRPEVGGNYDTAYMWVAIRTSDAPITSPGPADFAGRWFPIGGTPAPPYDFKTAGSINLNGATNNQCFRAPSFVGQAIPSQFTLVYWLNLRSLQNVNVLFSLAQKADGASDQFFARVRTYPSYPTDRSIYLSITTQNGVSATDEISDGTNVRLTLGQRIMLVLTLDNGYFEFWQDGMRALTNGVNGVQLNAGRIPTTFGGFDFGRIPEYDTLCSDQAMDEISFYNRILAPAEIQRLWGNGQGASAAGIAGQMAYWKFDEMLVDGTGNYVPDASGNGRKLYALNGANLV